MKKVSLNIGDKVIYHRCVCGEGGITQGNTYTVLKVNFPLFSFIDDNGNKRVKNIQTRCFEKVEVTNG